MRGQGIAPDDQEYESARLVTNAAVDRRPALIVRPADSADVALTVELARAQDRELAVRGGGHSLAGHGTSDGGYVLDMSSLRALHVDPQRRIAWAQAGSPPASTQPKRRGTDSRRDSVTPDRWGSPG